MGTRGLIQIFDKSNTYKLALYGQWDHHRRSQGADILKFLNAFDNIQKLEDSLDKIQFLNDEEYKEIQPNEWVTLNQSEQLSNDYPGLSRDTGSDILDYIISDVEKVLTVDSSEFRDSRSCEGHYVINFHDGTLTCRDDQGTDIYSLNDLPKKFTIKNGDDEE